MSNYTFLTKEQVFNKGKMLEVIKKRGTQAAITDFSILLGGWAYISRYSCGIVLSDYSSLTGRTGEYWTKSADGVNFACACGCEFRR